MNGSTIEILKKFRNKGFNIQDEEAIAIEKYCYRKMEVAKIEDQESYLPLLFEDEVENYLFRQAINATTMIRKVLEECPNVRNMQTSTLSSQVS